MPVTGRTPSSGRVRLLGSFGVGVLVAGVVVATSHPRYGLLAGLMTMAAGYTGWTYLTLRRLVGFETKADALREDASPWLRDAGIALVIAANLGGVVTLLLLDRSEGHLVDAALAVGSVVLSWFLLHTFFLLHYAALFYAEPAGDRRPTALDPARCGRTGVGGSAPVHVAGGIDFNDDGYWPTYADFTYFAFNLGMTFQVSDTSVSSPAVRRLVLGHCLLSYFFATAITATVINLVVGLVT